MSSTKKQIVIDSSSLSGSGSASTNNTTMKRQRKIKPPATLLRPSTLKQNLLQKIKEHKTRHEETPTHGGGSVNSTNNNNPSNQDLANQFKMSTNYLEQLMHKKKEARKHNKKSMRSPQQSQQVLQPQQSQQMLQPQQSQQMLQPQQSQQMLQPQMLQPQMLQPQMLQPQVSLELPPELQINPIMMPPIIPQIIPQVIPQIVPQVIPPIVVPAQLESFDPFNTEPSDSEHSDSEHSNPDPSLPQKQNPNPTVVLKDVPYGCLRNGNKPTYRTYHRNRGQPDNNHNNHNNHNTTVKHALFSGTGTSNSITITDSSNDSEDPMILERQRKLREIQENFQKSNTPPNTITEPTQIKNKIKQTITKKYKLGKTPGSNVVGVLIKNSDTRRRIQEEHGVLRRESIVDVRKYLHDHGLVKVGSDAPPDVLRNIYESAKMTGEISNTNKNVMLHNFLKSEDNSDNTN